MLRRTRSLPDQVKAMEGLSIAANSIAVISVVFQLTDACIKLYGFWESIEDAPQEISAIREDLQYLISIFKRFESNNDPIGDCIAEGIQHCRIKVLELTTIIEKFDVGFQSRSRRKRKWTAFKAAIHSGHIQRFRDSLNETKSTLTLAMVHQSFVQSLSQRHNTSARMNGSEKPPYRSIILAPNQGTPSQVWVEDDYAVRHKLITPSVHRGKLHLKSSSKSAHKIAKNVLMSSERSFSERNMASLQLKELMLHAIEQTAIATFESNSLEIFAQDTYTVDGSGCLRSRTFVYSENLRYRIRHHTSSFRTAIGCVWVRTTKIYSLDEASDAQESSQCVTSFVFYPTGWIQHVGVRSGLEAVMAFATRSWAFNCRLTVTRAVPEDSLIFELCRTGQTKAVATLFSKGLASIVDTSPKGWKPLHFAAAGGHVALCAMLIEAGADKSALVYEGPTPSIRSPISIFVACASNLHADVRISMLRLFSDCIDIADSDGDGWTVHEWLKRTFATERVPISQNSIMWLLHATANEEYVELNPRIAWLGLQHGVRSILCHEHHSHLLRRIFELSDSENETISPRHVDSIGLLLALRISGRVLLPMALTAGSFLQIKGFDWVQDDMTHRQYLQALPTVYSAWCHALLDCVENVEDYLQLELEECLQQLNWTRTHFLGAILHNNTMVGRKDEKFLGSSCTRCDDNYSFLPSALVVPSQIAASECARTGHTFGCVCQQANESDIVQKHTEPRDYSEAYLNSANAEDLDDDEIFYDAEPCDFDDSILPSQKPADIFSDIAVLLYRAHGRAWLGEYAPEEHLCTTCFLHRECYTDEYGSIADFPPMPEHFNGLRFRW